MREEAKPSFLHSGIKYGAILASATPVLKTVTGWTEYSLSGWLAYWVSAYQALIYPIFDIPAYALTGYTFAQSIKDFLVFYFAVGVSFVNGFNFNGKMKNIHKLKTAFNWPIIFSFLIFFHTFSYFNADARKINEEMIIRDDDGVVASIRGIPELLSRILREFAKIVVVVMFVLLLNSAGELT